VPQSPFTLNNTLRENILFGAEWDLDKYEDTLRLCCLEQDLKSLPGGDLAIIGERGINLSGGQKMRVAIARAVYADCDTIILDDPLAAVDSHVASALFYSLIVEQLKDKAVLLITNQVQFLRDTSHIVVMENGRIAEQGTYERLNQNGGKFSELVASSQGEASNDNENGEEGDGDGHAKDGAAVQKDRFIFLDDDKQKEEDARGNKTETMVSGTTPWPVFKTFFRAGGEGKYSVAISALLVFFVSELGQLVCLCCFLFLVLLFPDCGSS
jgi:ABC-type multidrug transport system ATPase subunit